MSVAAGKTALALALAAMQAALPASPACAQERPGVETTGELRIVDIRLRDRSTLAGDMFAWQDGEELYLPAEQSFAVLGFPITVAPDGKACGWFLREKQRFELDPLARSVTVAGRAYELEPADFAIIEGVPHVSLGALNRWFSLGARFASDRQVIVVDPPYLLADEEIARRSGARHGGAGARDEIDSSGFKSVDPAYRLLGWPHLTANLSASHDGAARQKFAASAQLLATGDMLFMTGRLALSLATRGENQARLTLGRRNADATLLGPLGATYFEFGDVVSNSLPLIARNGSGVGFRVGREPITRADSFDTTDIIGDATPGWQAELFRDGELLAFQEIGTDGRFVFAGVPLRFGANRFRVQLYGPSGERDSVDRTIDIADTLIEPGSVRYSVAMFDSTRSLFGERNFADLALDGEGEQLDDGLYAEANAGLGLSGKLSLSGFAAVRERKAEPLRAWFGASGAWRAGPALLSGDIAVQDDGELAWTAGALTGLGAFSLSLAREEYSRGFDSQESRAGSSGGIASRTDATIDGRLPNLGIALSLGEIRQFDGTRDRSAQLRMSGKLLGLSTTHRLAWRELVRPGAARERRTDGDLAVSGAIGELRLRGGLEYDITPDLKLRRARAEVNYRLAEWYFQAGFDRDLENRSSQWRLATNRDWIGVRLGLEGRYDDRRGDVRILATLAFALDRGPDRELRLGRAARSDRGQLHVSGFHDRDGNGIRGADEPELGLRFITDPRGRSLGGDQVIEDLPVDRVVALAPDLASNPDPFLVPAVQGYRVMMRPGALQRVEVPLVDSADAELVLRDAGGGPVAGVVVELQPCQGGPAAAARTAHDGLAYFRQLLPGCYRVARPAGVEAEFELVAKDVLRRILVVSDEEPAS